MTLASVSHSGSGARHVVICDCRELDFAALIFLTMAYWSRWISWEFIQGSVCELFGGRSTLALFVYFSFLFAVHELRSREQKSLMMVHVFLNNVIHCVINNPIQQSTSWETDSYSASQGINRISLNPKVHCRIHKLSPPVPILSCINSGNSYLSHLFKIHFNIILPYIPRSCKWSLSLRSPNQKSHAFLLSPVVPHA